MPLFYSRSRPEAKFSADYSQRTGGLSIATMCCVREVQKSAVGRILRIKRESLGISQEALAERAGVDRSYVSITGLIMLWTLYPASLRLCDRPELKMRILH
jgi:helix-turn-helix protein